jgi:hypothetical protein
MFQTTNQTILLAKEEANHRIIQPAYPHGIPLSPSNAWTAGSANSLDFENWVPLNFLVHNQVPYSKYYIVFSDTPISSCVTNSWLYLYNIYIPSGNLT